MLLNTNSFGITMYELFFEIRPYSSIKQMLFNMDKQATDISDSDTEDLDSIVNFGIAVVNGRRPQIPDINYTAQERVYLALMQRCWDHNAAMRPAFTEIIDYLERQAMPS